MWLLSNYQDPGKAEYNVGPQFVLNLVGASIILCYNDLIVMFGGP